MFLLKPVVFVLLTLTLVTTVVAQGDTAPDYARRGDQIVGVIHLTIEGGDYPLNATLWYPALNPNAADERVTTIVALAPCCVEMLGADGLAGMMLPIMVMAGTADTTAPPDQNGMAVYENANSLARALVLIEDGGHEVYLDIYSGPIARAHDRIQHFATAFFLDHLKGDSQAAALLDPAVVNFAEIMYSAIGMEAESS